jgi:hypothetical protein
MAYDQATGQLVLFAGAGTNGILDDTWTWDGSTWTEQSPATSPPALYYASMAYDQATGQLVLFGGFGSGANGVLAQTWTWDGSTWTQQSPAISPPPSEMASMAYDPATGQLVLFGGVGQGQTGIMGDTWIWDGTTWTQQSPATSPPPLSGADLAYDPATTQLVLFGGGNDQGDSADTWTWDGTTWTQQSPATSPSPRFFASMAYDPATTQLVLFGGGNDGGESADTWTWDGTTWTQQSPATSPSARSVADMAYDPATSQLVLVGGIGETGIFGDTWTYTAGQSQSITFSSTAPSPASYSGANNQAYAASATATSGLPVTLSIDPASTSACAIFGNTISYGTGAGTCIIDANQPGNSSYLPAPQATQSFTVKPASLSVTASSATMTYGGTVPAITPSYSGFVGNDNPSSLSTPPSCFTTATSTSVAGTYPATCSGAVDPNYTINYIRGTVTINKAATATTLKSEPDPAARRSPVKLTVAVTPTEGTTIPAGNVNFYAGRPARYHKLLGTTALTTSGAAVFTTTALTCGSHRLYAVYVGSANDTRSTSAIDIETIRCAL